MTSEDPLAKVKGLGASAQGSPHWLWQRVSAIALVPLSFWFVFAIISHIADSHEAVVAWVSQPFVALILVLYLGFMLFHAQLGVQEVIEDYVHSDSLKFTSLMLVKGLAILLAIVSIFAVLRIAL